MMRIIYILLSIAGVFFLAGVWLYVLDKIGLPKSDAVKDLLPLLLTVVGFILTVFAIAGFLSLRNALQQEITKEITAPIHRAIARSYIDQGYSLWVQYQNTGRDILLQEAINNCARAYVGHAEGLDEAERNNEQLVCSLRNNWGYYLATKPSVTDDDRVLALWFAKYLEDRVGKYPDDAPDWSDTIRHIRTRFQPH